MRKEIKGGLAILSSHYLVTGCCSGCTTSALMTGAIRVAVCHSLRLRARECHDWAAALASTGYRGLGVGLDFGDVDEGRANHGNCLGTRLYRLLRT